VELAAAEIDGNELGDELIEWTQAKRNQKVV